MGVIAWLIITALQVYPLWQILPRAGIASPWALAAGVPLGTVALLWWMAYRRWPGDDVAGRFD